ncbi:hypothetical protein VE02_07945 [Pseudogymnoascus sp. 03VT05]|nr:hypothetical protein VE02_07945 [Pseudogymnoascus sp. 03VT05]
MSGQSSNTSASRSSPSRASAGSEDKYADSTVSEKMARRDATSMATYYNTSRNLNREVIAVKIVVHTLGSQQTHDGRSGNHWSIFLILAGAELRSVRLNMMSDGLDDRGHLEVTDKTFHVTTSTLADFDYSVAPRTTVHNFCRLITGNGHDKYLMSGTGNGCRYWV